MLVHLNAPFHISPGVCCTDPCLQINSFPSVQNEDFTRMRVGKPVAHGLPISHSVLITDIVNKSLALPKPYYSVFSFQWSMQHCKVNLRPCGETASLRIL